MEEKRRCVASCVSVFRVAVGRLLRNRLGVAAALALATWLHLPCTCTDPHMPCREVKTLETLKGQSRPIKIILAPATINQSLDCR